MRKLTKDPETEPEKDPPVTFSFYEQDLDKGTPPRLVRKITTRQQMEEENKKWKKALEAATTDDPNYDDTEFKRQALDDMIRDPTYARIRDVLEDLRASVMSREEAAKEVGKAGGDYDKLESAFIMEFHKVAQDMLDNPEYAAAHDELRDFQAKLGDAVKDEAGYQAAAMRLSEKLETIPAFQREAAELEKEEKEAKKKLEGSKPIRSKFARSGDLHDLLHNSEDADVTEEDIDALARSMDEKDPENIKALLRQMKELMATIGGNKEIEDEIQAILDEDPLAGFDTEKEAEQFRQGFDANELSAELAKFQNAPPEDDFANVDPKALALVDEMMADPNLIHKLAAMQQHLEKQKAAQKATQQTTQKATPKAKPPPSAPDPETLDKSRLTTYRQRLAIAESDPEHLEALDRLRVDLQTPFNVFPAVKSFNEALKLAYLGASDDVRRILWRSYMKARAVPTLLQNIPDDAWDILYYSQAVTWGSNQNRTTHLKILLHDLRSVEKDGPPTHPDALADQQ
jgi:hypothetical protein